MKTPEEIDITESEASGLLERIKGSSLIESDKILITGVIVAFIRLKIEYSSKKRALGNLLKSIFGSKTEKKKIKEPFL